MNVIYGLVFLIYVVLTYFLVSLLDEAVIKSNTKRNKRFFIYALTILILSLIPRVCFDYFIENQASKELFDSFYWLYALFLVFFVSPKMTKTN